MRDKMVCNVSQIVLKLGGIIMCKLLTGGGLGYRGVQ